jgi:hypothetical protein
MWLKINDPAGKNSTFINLDEMLDIQLTESELRLALPGRNYRISPADAAQVYKKICSSLESGFQGAVECEAGLVIA